MKSKTAVIKISSHPLAKRSGSKGLLADVRKLVVVARQTIARGVNSELVRLYWLIGRRIHRHILQEKRAEYGKEIIAALSQELGWSHFVELLPLGVPLQRDFYAEMCRIERWSVRTLRKKIQGMLFERTALSKKPAKLAAMELKQLREDDRLTPDLVFRDPYLLVSSSGSCTRPCGWLGPVSQSHNLRTQSRYFTGIAMI